MIDVGISRDESKRMVLRTVEAQLRRTFAPVRPGKLARLAGALLSLQAPVECSTKFGRVRRDGSHEEECEEAAMSRETVLVPAADETVRTTLKHWLQDSWKNR
eukprot:evm.model.scf_1245.3 EVM.evm.TU.scf_1245.3   scf_1245:30803-31109(+)